MLMLSIVSVARDALRGLMLSLCDIIYRLIVFVYDVFYNLGTARLLTDKDIQPIFQRIGLIIGLFMVFRVTFAFIQYIINPETMIDRQKGIGKIVTKVVISIVLLGSTQYLFNAAFAIQNKVLESQVLEKVILGGEYVETESGMRDFGSNLSATIFSSFYRINDDPYLSKPEVYNLCENILGKNNDMLKENIRINSGSIVGSGANICLNVKSEYNNYDEQMEEIISSSKETKEEYIINFDGDGLLTVLVGLVCLYTGIMFTFQIGVRLIQLAYLELIAPIPIIMYVTPKGDDQLKKWVTQCTTTFLDFFLRIAIIYFAKFIIEIILNADILGSIYAESNGIYNVYITCVMIIATLLFVKKVPNLLKEIFPPLGGAAGFDYGMDIKKTVNGTLAPALFGAAVGAAGGLASNAIHGYMNTRKDFREKGKKAGFKSIGKGLLSTVGGAFGGAKAGLGTKDITKMGNAVKVANANREKRELMAKAGYRWYNSAPKRIADSVLSFAGETSGAEAKMKTAQFRQEALQQSKALAWESFYKANPTADLGLLRSIQEFEEKGKKVYKGIDKTGKELTFTKNAAGDYINTDAAGRNILGVEAATVSDSLDKDKQIKDQGKIIKGLQTADEKSKK